VKAKSIKFRRKLLGRSFEYDVVDYDIKSNKYTLVNKGTGVEMKIDKDYYEELVEEQTKKK